jgi:hypothetical protein
LDAAAPAVGDVATWRKQLKVALNTSIERAGRREGAAGPTSGAGVRAEMRAASEAGVAFRSYPTARAAVSAISDQVVFGALVIERAAATLLVSSHAREPRWW